MLSPLTNRTYRHLFAAQVIALIGTGLLTVALGLLAYDLAGADAGAVLGTALAIKMVAYVGVAPVVGAFADRLPRRAFLVAMDLVRAAIALSLPFVTEVWQIYVLIFVLQSASAAFTPTFQATIPEVLPDEAEYTKALSLARLAYDLESLASPALAAALLAVIGYHDLFAGTVVGFLGSALLVGTVALPVPVSPAERSGGIYDRITRGIRIYLKTPRLQGLLALNGAVAAAGAMVIVNTVVIVRGVLGGTDADVAVVLAAYGAGSMAVAFLLPRLLERVSDRAVMLAGAWLLAAGTLVMAVILVQRRAAGASDRRLASPAAGLVCAGSRQLGRADAHRPAAPAVRPCGRPPGSVRGAVRPQPCLLAGGLSAGRVGWGRGRRGGGFHGAGHSGGRGDGARGLVLAGGRCGRGRACPYALRARTPPRP